MTTERCIEQWCGPHKRCELAAGHEGPHRATDVEWTIMPPLGASTGFREPAGDLQQAIARAEAAEADVRELRAENDSMRKALDLHMERANDRIRENRL